MHDDPERRQVQARREPVPAEDPEPEEGRLEEERGEALDRERRAEDVADELRVHRPVHPELELLDEAGRDADREVDQEERPEEASQPQPRSSPVRCQMRLHHGDERRRARASAGRTGSGRATSSRTGRARGRPSIRDAQLHAFRPRDSTVIAIATGDQSGPGARECFIRVNFDRRVRATVASSNGVEDLCGGRGSGERPSPASRGRPPRRRGSGTARLLRRRSTQSEQLNRRRRDDPNGAGRRPREPVGGDRPVPSGPLRELQCRAQPCSGCQLVGGVGYSYEIGELEITVRQYVAFLNTVDPDGTRPARPLRPRDEPFEVAEVRLDSALVRRRGRRGQALLGRLSGVGGQADRLRELPACGELRQRSHERRRPLAHDVVRRRLRGRHLQGAALEHDRRRDVRPQRPPGATRKRSTGFVVPSQNEWIKAAYYDPKGGGTFSYWRYPTGPFAAPHASSAGRGRRRRQR